MLLKKNRVKKQPQTLNILGYYSVLSVYQMEFGFLESHKTQLCE